MAYALGRRVCDCTATRFAQARQILKHSGTKNTKVGILNIRNLRALVRKYMCRYDPGDKLHEGSVIPAKAGIHLLPPLDAGLRRHDKSMKEPVEGGWAISYAVDERKLMNTSW